MRLLPDLSLIVATIIQALPVSVPIKHEYSVFQWPWQRGRLIEPHEQEVLRGQQDVPWLRRRGSKNSRKLLYFVEWAQECKMSAVFFFFLFLRSELYHMLEATGFEDNVTLFDACVALHWHTDVCGHPPLHSPLIA